MENAVFGIENPNDGFHCNYPDCGKTLSSKYNLKRHIESCHLGIRPYECLVCFKRFSSKQNKREHMRFEHSYSKLTPIEVPAGVVLEREIELPSLTDLLCKCEDPSIRPFSKVNRIYLFPEKLPKKSLPPLDC